jgi:hypothetical protein
VAWVPGDLSAELRPVGLGFPRYLIGCSSQSLCSAALAAAWRSRAFSVGSGRGSCGFEELNFCSWGRRDAKRARVSLNLLQQCTAVRTSLLGKGHGVESSYWRGQVMSGLVWLIYVIDTSWYARCVPMQRFLLVLAV